MQRNFRLRFGKAFIQTFPVIDAEADNFSGFDAHPEISAAFLPEVYRELRSLVARGRGSGDFEAVRLDCSVFRIEFHQIVRMDECGGMRFCAFGVFGAEQFAQSG